MIWHNGGRGMCLSCAARSMHPTHGVFCFHKLTVHLPCIALACQAVLVGVWFTLTAASTRGTAAHKSRTMGAVWLARGCVGGGVQW
jgi:hypothetical protein